MKSKERRPAVNLLQNNIYDLAITAEWAPQFRNNLALLGAGERGKNKVRWREGMPNEVYNQEVKTWYARLCQEVTLQEVMLALEEEYRQLSKNKYWTKHRTKLTKIVALGLNHQDSVALLPTPPKWSKKPVKSAAARQG